MREQIIRNIALSQYHTARSNICTIRVYNIGYEVKNGENWVDNSSIAKADEVDPHESHRIARQQGESIRVKEIGKSDDRVILHSARTEKYLGKKYAWRIYGMALSKETFFAYLEVINHPWVSCTTDGTPSTAYKEDGLGQAIDRLINTCVRVKNNNFKSRLLPNQRFFRINGNAAITDKK